jgi:regulatory factor X 1/2/3
MVIGDLTLRRSAASFGSFHLIRLLYDGEYIFYLVEHRVAMVTGEFVNMTLRPKDEDEAGSTSVPPSPIADRRHHYSAVCPV